MRCPRCAREFEGNFCPNCGLPVHQQMQQSQQHFQQQFQQQPTYQQNQQRPLPPPLPPYYPSNTTKQKKKRGCLYYGLLAFAVLMFIGLIGSVLSDPDDSSNSDSQNKSISDQSETVTSDSKATTTPTATPAPTLSPENSFIESVTKDAGLKEKSASNLYDVLTGEIGFSDVEYVGKSDYSDSVLIINADKYELTANLDDDEIYKIKFGSLILYDDSTVIINKQGVLDRIITDDVAYYSIAQEIVKNNLKSPKSADFPSIVWSPDEISMQRNGDLVAVQSYVDAQNSFGAEIRSEFLVEFQVIDIDTYTYLSIYINIDGESSGEFIDLD